VSDISPRLITTANLQHTDRRVW